MHIDEDGIHTYSAVKKPFKFYEGVILSENLNEVTHMKAHFSKGLHEDDLIIKVIYDEVKSRFYVIKKD